MAWPTLLPREAKRLVDEGAILIDIREDDEHARIHIPGAHHIALSRFDRSLMAASSGKTIIFHCRSGARTLGHASRLIAGAGPACKAYLLEGGLEAWRAAGFPVAAEARPSLEWRRRIRIAAGRLVTICIDGFRAMTRRLKRAQDAPDDRA